MKSSNYDQGFQGTNIKDTVIFSWHFYQEIVSAPQDFPNQKESGLRNWRFY